ncbi:hypothetical protein [Chengkuizengella axinellae]|uniref:Rho termination factor N-terminal domain-containing protein n=1 Tax=Chengkuizengella axinellae TaxID=3064388 RepID=A0ABT9IWY5_9BACL|nr:hypothetical protein [Chengkuizengella sp. 2205SS18-9]MDP5273300.1 hypothetical protein [Chengkuizengella sp. 2205SS18-9]
MKNKKSYLLFVLLVALSLVAAACSSAEEQPIIQEEFSNEDEVLVEEQSDRQNPVDFNELPDDQLHMMAERFEIDVTGLSREEIISLLEEQGPQMGGSRPEGGMGGSMDLTELSDDELLMMAERFEIDVTGLSREEIISLLEEQEPQMGGGRPIGGMGGSMDLTELPDDELLMMAEQLEIDTSELSRDEIIETIEEIRPQRK